MIGRILEESIKAKLFKGKAIVILGPRQVGKTTLLKKIATNLKDTLWLNADNFEVQTLFEIPSSSRFKAIIKNHKIVIIDEGPEIINEPDVFVWVEERPSFGNGYADLMNYLNGCLVYPRKELETGIDGTVHLKFVVDEKGNIKDISVQRSASKGLDREAIRCVSKMPKWNPGKQRGIPVKVWFNLPVKFTLR